MKPILHITLPRSASQYEMAQLLEDAKISVNNEYHVLITYGFEMQVLNGEQLTELTFEQFKQQYIK